MTAHGRKYPRMSEAKRGKPWMGHVRRIVVHVHRETYFRVGAKAKAWCKVKAAHVLPGDETEAYVEHLIECDVNRDAI